MLNTKTGFYTGKCSGLYIPVPWGQVLDAFMNENATVKKAVYSLQVVAEGMGLLVK